MVTQLTHTEVGDSPGEGTRRTAEAVESRRVLHPLQHPRRGHDKLISHNVGHGTDDELTIIHLVAAAVLDGAVVSDRGMLSCSWSFSLLSSGSGPGRHGRLPLRH